MQSKKWAKLNKGLETASREKEKGLRGVKIASVIAEAFSEIGIEPILVGGAAVAFYTDGRYVTADIDLIAPSGKDVDTVMKGLGFSRLGKDFINERLKIYIEFPSSTLGPTERYNRVKLKNVGVRVISLEDLVVDRLCAFKFWRSSVDGLNALMLLECGRVDRERVERRAREEDAIDALDHIEAVLESVTRKKMPKKEAVKMLNSFISRHL